MKKNILILSIISILSIFLLLQNIFEVENYTGSKPNFTKIKDVKQLKTTFLNYLLPFIEAENERILLLREKIKTSKDKDFLDKLAEKYYAKNSDKDELLKRIDIISTSLALAQAANESAWGRSRFAKNYNNYYGMWCFKKGCGVIPKRRSRGDKNEVAKFKSAADSVSNYMKTLNSHRSYEKLRTIRLDLRKSGKKITGKKLAYGLDRYSAQRAKYTKIMHDIIRVNKLDKFD